VKPTAAGSSLTTVAMKERSGGLAYALYAANGAGKPPAGYVDQSGADTSTVGSSALPLNAWSYLTVTYDGSHLRIYVNGTLAHSKALTGAMTTSNSPFRIGGNSVLGQYFTGVIDEVRLYNKALTRAQIRTDMNTPVGTAPSVNLISEPTDVLAPPVSIASITIDEGSAQNSEVGSVAVSLSSGPSQLELNRLLDDTNEDGVIGQIDVGHFDNSLNAGPVSASYLSYLDADNDGMFDQVDRGQF
jgi:hypothetical protein